MRLKERAAKLKTDIPAVFLAFKHRETPMLAKILAGAIVCYALSPIDLIPDFIPLLGYLDDVILLPVLVALAIKLIPANVLAQCRKEAEGLRESDKPKKWYYALPVMLLWGLLLFVMAKAIFF